MQFTAAPLTLDEAVVVPHRLQALVYVEQLRVMLEAIKRFDIEIESVTKQHDDYALFSALPGSGPSLAPRLLVAFGEQRERYNSTADIQKYSGIAPVTERSCKKHWVHWRWQCPTFLRQTFVEWAAQTINKFFWADEYYRQQRAKGSAYQAAVRALALKWIRILFRCWQTQTPYDEVVYLKALERRGSPLLTLAKNGLTEHLRATFGVRIHCGLGDSVSTKKPNIRTLHNYDQGYLAIQEESIYKTDIGAAITGAFRLDIGCLM